MPKIKHFKCNQCDFSMPSGWGGYMYVEDDSGKRIVCLHPVEMNTVAKALGENATKELINSRTGFNSHCLCMDCLKQFDLNLKSKSISEGIIYRIFKILHLVDIGHSRGKDERRCPHCNSQNVRTVFELINKTCPKCKKGLIKEIFTGMIS